MGPFSQKALSIISLRVQCPLPHGRVRVYNISTGISLPRPRRTGQVEIVWQRRAGVLTEVGACEGRDGPPRGDLWCLLIS